MNEIEIYSLSLTKDRLSKLTEDEKHFLFLITHLSNEIGMLLKACLYTNNVVGDEIKPNDIEYQASVTQFYFWTRMLAGKLYEGWNLLQVKYFPTSLSRKYANHEKLRKAVDEIKQYFSRGDSLLELIRNSYAFHVADRDKKITALLEMYPDSHVYQFHHCDHVGGRFYFASEDLIIHSVRNEYIKSHNGKDYSHDDLVKEILKVTTMFNHLVNEYFVLCTQIIVDGDEKIMDECIKTISVKGFIMDEINLPYFSVKKSESSETALHQSLIPS